MDRAERVLYHQIHPAKLATDLTADVASTVLLWRHRLVAGLVVRFVPALVASAVLMRRTEDLERLRASATGRYVHDHMTPQAQGVRALGDVLTGVGAWRRRPAIIVLGWAVVVAPDGLAGCCGKKGRRRPWRDASPVTVGVLHGARGGGHGWARGRGGEPEVRAVLRVGR